MVIIYRSIKNCTNKFVHSAHKISKKASKGNQGKKQKRIEQCSEYSKRNSYRLIIKPSVYDRFLIYVPKKEFGEIVEKALEMYFKDMTRE